jgi:hypothetical protein
LRRDPCALTLPGCISGEVKEARVRIGLLAGLVLVTAGAAAEEMKPPRITAVPVDWAAATAQVASLPLGAPRTRSAAIGAATAAQDDALARLNRLMGKRFDGIGASAVPVLLPFDVPAFLKDAAAGRGDRPAADYLGGFLPGNFFYGGASGFDAIFRINPRDVRDVRLTYAQPIAVEISGTRLFYDPQEREWTSKPVKVLEPDVPDVRRVLRENHIRYTFNRFGARYIVSIQCFDRPARPKRLACREADHVATRFIALLQLAGGMPQPAAEPAAASAVERPSARSASFSYHPPGHLIDGTGYRKHSGQADYTVYARIRFPMAEAPAFIKSQSFLNWGDCFLKGRVPRPKRKGDVYRCKVNNKQLVFDESAQENFSYPWRDNFCEMRDTEVGQCPGGYGHQGQDIRPASCVLRNGQADRCEPYHHDLVAVRDGVVLREPEHQTFFLVVNTASERIRFRYMHMNPARLTDAGILSGRRVQQGEIIGQVGTYNKHERGTSYHLHFDMQVMTKDGWVWVNPYMTLVASYEWLIGARGQEMSERAIAASPAAAQPSPSGAVAPETR